VQAPALSGDSQTLYVVNNDEGGTVAVYDLTVEVRERQFLRTKLVDIAPA